MEDGQHPLLSSIEDEYHNLPHSSQIRDVVSYDEEDHVGPSKGIQFFLKEFYEESKKLWNLAAPAILTSVCQYSLGAITQVFAGQLGTTQLAMFSVENSIIAGIGYGIMDAEVSVDASSICANIVGWTLNMAGFGLNAAISVRVSNELGASHPRTAKFSAVVVVVTSFLIGLFLGLILIVTAKQYPSWFSTDTEVQELVYKLTPFLGMSIVLFNLQLALAGIAGVAIGAGWQAYVAFVNLGCYYVVGIPLCLLLALKFNLGIQVSFAGDRLKQWGGEADENQN
ncbi:hypothetical protein Vadar_030817 [Vaccinium darrowii]|uniref:Uncharacterized protein n=1 Tax=Vaccinium darrowii TaxID=229202 RepID=A0ACB7YZU9_9ERIC|nr:hypothetical protein Vadar_030817 [Vaccinium darrowii]